MVRQLVRDGRAQRDPPWACYHTDLYRVREGSMELGIVGCAVGAPFAVLVAEQLFASGCGLLISMTSAGQLVRLRPPPYFVLIDKALRDEGTSYHYLPPAEFSHASERLMDGLAGAWSLMFSTSMLSPCLPFSTSTPTPFTFVAVVSCSNSVVPALTIGIGPSR
jgi:hypothetical protein